MGILLDDKKQRILERDGVVKFSLLDNNQTSLLSDYFLALHPEITDSFYVCIESPDREYKTSIHDKVKQTIEVELNKHLQEFRALIYTMQVKGTGKNSALGVHQDWSVTDETKYRSYSLWIPLIDTNVENGGMFAIKGSHKICKNTRGPSISPPYSGHEEFLISKMKHMPVKAGEALLFDQALLHHTPPNKSSTPRISVISTIIAAQAELRLYFLNKENEKPVLEYYQAPDQFWFEYENYAEERFQRPKFGPLAGELGVYNPEPFVDEDFSKALKGVNNERFKENLFQSIGLGWLFPN